VKNQFSNILNPCVNKYYASLLTTREGYNGRSICVKISKDGKLVRTGPGISGTAHFKKQCNHEGIMVMFPCPT
jgi:hypothetical protein